MPFGVVFLEYFQSQHLRVCKVHLITPIEQSTHSCFFLSGRLTPLRSTDLAPEKKASAAGSGGVPVFTIGDQPMARRGSKPLCRPELQYLSPGGQLVQVVGPLLNLVKPLLEVLGAVVAAPVGVFHCMGQVRFNRQGV